MELLLHSCGDKNRALLQSNNSRKTSYSRMWRSEWLSLFAMQSFWMNEIEVSWWEWLKVYDYYGVRKDNFKWRVVVIYICVIENSPKTNVPYMPELAKNYLLITTADWAKARVAQNRCLVLLDGHFHGCSRWGTMATHWGRMGLAVLLQERENLLIVLPF